ncbi:hypothetical protein [Streptomyces narbonensis]
MWRERELRAVTAATCLAFTGIGALTTTGVLLATPWAAREPAAC